MILIKVALTVSNSVLYSGVFLEMRMAGNVLMYNIIVIIVVKND
jgi:hypothetical protein